MDAMRKRALAAVSQYLEALGNEEFLGKDYQGRMAYPCGASGKRQLQPDRESASALADGWLQQDAP